MPRYIDPTIDIAFKKLFANQSKKEIVISFLNSILGRSEGSLITHVVINDPANLPQTIDAKFSIVDVYCTDQKNHHYIIEMQVTHQDYYRERSQYYISAATTKQLGKGEAYRNLCPTIFIGVLNFNALKNPHYLSYLTTYCEKYPEDNLPLHHYYFIELPKFTKKLEELDTLVDKWIYFLKYASEYAQAPEELLVDEPMKEAFLALEESMLSPVELAAYEKAIDNRRVESDVLASLQNKALTAEKIGKQKGFEEGIQTIALRLLSQQRSLEEVMHITGLTHQELIELQKIHKQRT